MKNLLTFEKLVGLSALFIAFCAAYFSILGIGMLFSGANIAAMVMASSLELGKLTATSFLYRYWSKTQTFLKIYLSIAIVTLIAITSLGIFGYLSSAYQSSSIENKISEDKITIIETQKKYSQDRIGEARKRIENITVLRNSQEQRLNASMTNTLIARNPIQMAELQQQTQELIEQSQKNLESENIRIQKSIDELQQSDKKITDLKLQGSGRKDILTFKFVAEAFNMELNTIVKWFISILIAVFDPLAICLLLAYNTAVYRKEEEVIEEEPIINTPMVEPIIETPKEEPIINTPVIEPITQPDISVQPINKPKRKTPSTMKGMFHF